MRRDLSARLVWLAAAGLLGGVAVAWVVSMAGPVRASVPNVPLAVPVTVLVGWSLIFSGFAWFASTLTDAHNPVLFTLGRRSTPSITPAFCI